MLQAIALTLLASFPSHQGAAPSAPPYDFSAAEALLRGELRALNGHVAVILRQNGVDLFRFQHGDIDFDTRTRLASLTKTVSAAVTLTCVEDGTLSLSERLGDSLPIFERHGTGGASVLDGWSMRHGIDAPRAYEHSPLVTLGQSVALIGLKGWQAFPAGAQLGYDGKGMQTVGFLAASRTAQSWEDLARTRIFEPCRMLRSDYRQFDPNPAVAGGMRGSAEELMRFADMIIQDGEFEGRRVLSSDSIELLFTNGTRDLPVHASPWPRKHELYPYGAEPDYAFGAWVLAEHPASQHVEEIVGAGAWGSYLWIDRRRGLTATLVTDVAPGSRSSMPAALGLFAIARDVVEHAQVHQVVATPLGESAVQVSWSGVEGASRYFVYGSEAPIRDVIDLAGASRLARVIGLSAEVRPHAYYAVSAEFEGFENRALVPDENSTSVAPREER